MNMTLNGRRTGLGVTAEGDMLAALGLRYGTPEATDFSTEVHKILAINGMPDHIHILIGLRPAQSISDLMKDIKQSSSRWINENKLTSGHFEWQEGYGAFSYSKSQISHVVCYIQNQELHHKKKTFRQEYLDFLDKFEVDYDEKFIFKELI